MKIFKNTVFVGGRTRHRFLTWNNPFDFFMYTACGLMLVSFIYIMFHNGEPIRSLLWSGPTVGIFPDFFEAVKDATRPNPYDERAIYPAFAYFLLYWVSKFIPYDCTNWPEISLTREGIATVAIFFLIITTCVCYLAGNFLKLHGGKALFLSICFICSPGYIYMAERGNVVILSVLFVMFFLYYYDSKNKILQELSLVSLACAVCMKLYPVFMGIELLLEKQYKKAMRCIFYGVIVFVLPFTFYEGVGEIPHLISNILYLSKETKVDERGFGYGYKIDISNFSRAIENYSGIHISFTMVMCIACICMAIVLFTLKENWKRIYVLTLFLTIIPSFSWIYNAQYFIIPLTFFFKDNKKMDIETMIYCIMFLLIMVSAPFGFVMETLPGACKISVSTVLIHLGMWGILMGLLGESVAVIIQRCVNAIRYK